MKKIFTAALAFMGIASMSNAQFSVYDANGDVLYTSETTPAYVDFKFNDLSKGAENGFDWVDLGLPSGTRWATCNIGAENPEDFGDYFA